MASPLALSAQSVSLVLVDFGTPTEMADAGSYNNVTTDNASWSVADLINSDGSSTGASLTYSLPVAPSTKSEGVSGLDQDGFSWVTAATHDSLFHSSFTELMTISLTGLTDGQEYQFAFFGDRNAYATVRPTDYTVTIGATSTTDTIASISHNGDSGPADIAIVNVTADASGLATITIGPGTGSDGQYHINVMQITAVSAVPEPSMLSLLFGGLALGVIVRRRRR